LIYLGIEPVVTRGDADIVHVEQDGAVGAFSEANQKLRSRIGADTGLLASRLRLRRRSMPTRRTPRITPAGVWTLPPTYLLGHADRGTHASLGEGDRMTLNSCDLELRSDASFRPRCRRMGELWDPPRSYGERRPRRTQDWHTPSAAVLVLDEYDDLAVRTAQRGGHLDGHRRRGWSRHRERPHDVHVM